MIIANGHIEFKAKQGGGIDPATGYPVCPAYAWSDPIPCQWIRTKHNYLGRSNDGEHNTEQSYTILIEQTHAVATEQIRLTDRTGAVLGEFSIVGVEPLDAVGQTRITV